MRNHLSVAVAVAGFALVGAGAADTPGTLQVRDRAQKLHLYGSRAGAPVVVASGDGGWVHLAPQVAEFLSRQGWFVVGFDSKAYLSSFTHGKTTLSEDDVRRDFRTLVGYAAGGGASKPILVGVSVGAGLSVLAATDPEVRSAIVGVVGLGLPDLNELGWRFRDSIIYLTKKTPDEPTFSVTTVIDGVAPLPLALLHSTRDENAPKAEIERIFARASEPKRLWLIPAENHRFSGAREQLEQRLLEAMDWIRAPRP